MSDNKDQHYHRVSGISGRTAGKMHNLRLAEAFKRGLGIRD